ncbi:hypothetical protein, partial [Nitrosopumilus sp.]|uniref:hypothetical protein n=1 Tax=Nitrosopumilus sp. TaxID=2024843 RepID=UPI0034A08023
MASLEKLVVQLRQKKQDATKIRQKTEEQLKSARASEKRSLSGLQTVDKKIESERETSEDVSTILTQKTSQLESIGRLIAMAEERLAKEKEAIEQIEQEIEFADNPEEKQNAEARLRSLNSHIGELVSEIKIRQKTADKISNDIANYSNIQSKINSTIQKQTKSKPTLRETKTTNHKTVQKLVAQLSRQVKSEQSIASSLESTTSKLKSLLAKKTA